MPMATERYAYTAYGEPSVLNKNGMPVPRSKVGNRYLFQGRRLDRESGLYYFRHRMMSGELGRFLQRDPVFALDLSLYWAFRGSPIRYLDSLGLLIGDRAQRLANQLGSDMEFIVENRAGCDRNKARREIKERMNELSEYKAAVRKVGISAMKAPIDAVAGKLGGMFGKAVEVTKIANSLRKAYLSGGTKGAFKKGAFQALSKMQPSNWENLETSKISSMLERLYTDLEQQTIKSGFRSVTEGLVELECPSQERIASSCSVHWEITGYHSRKESYRISCNYLRMRGKEVKCSVRAVLAGSFKHRGFVYGLKIFRKGETSKVMTNQ